LKFLSHRSFERIVDNLVKLVNLSEAVSHAVSLRDIKLLSGTRLGITNIEASIVLSCPKCCIIDVCHVHLLMGAEYIFPIPLPLDSFHAGCFWVIDTFEKTSFLSRSKIDFVFLEEGLKVHDYIIIKYTSFIS